MPASLRFYAGGDNSIRGYDYQVDAARVDFEHLRAFLAERRGFMLRLLENPMLMEHEMFTDLLLAVFHLTEELTHRRKVTDLLAADQAHLAGDVLPPDYERVRELDAASGGRIRGQSGTWAPTPAGSADALRTRKS